MENVICSRLYWSDLIKCCSANKKNCPLFVEVPSATVQMVFCCFCFSLFFVILWLSLCFLHIFQSHFISFFALYAFFSLYLFLRSFCVLLSLYVLLSLHVLLSLSLFSLFIRPSLPIRSSLFTRSFFPFFHYYSTLVIVTQFFVVTYFIWKSGDLLFWNDLNSLMHLTQTPHTLTT